MRCDMEIVLQLIISVIAAVGVGFILSDILKIPKYGASKAVTTLGKRQKKKTNPLDIWLGDLSNFIAGKLKLGEYKRLQLKVDLDSADMTLSPEQYVANAIVKALFVGVFAIPFLFFAPIRFHCRDRPGHLFQRIQKGRQCDQRKTQTHRIRVASLGVQH